MDIFDRHRIPVGLRDGTPITISEINSLTENGLKCGCVCPVCGLELVAKKQGGVMAPHFAHRGSGENCNGATETGLHLLAKDIFKNINKKKFYLPSARPDFIEASVFHGFTGGWVTIEGVEIEPRLNGTIPDIVLFLDDGRQIIVEIAVHHFVDEQKINLLRSQNAFAMEIVLSDFVHSDVIREKVEEILFGCVVDVEKSHHSFIKSKYWLSHPDYNVELKKQNNKLDVQLENIERIISPIYQFMQKDESLRCINGYDHVVSFCANNGLDINNIPFYCNLEYTSNDYYEELFKCHRNVWQIAILKYCLEHETNSFTLRNIYKYFVENYQFLIEKDLVYLRDTNSFLSDDIRRSFNLGTLADAIKYYLDQLVELNILFSNKNGFELTKFWDTEYKVNIENAPYISDKLNQRILLSNDRTHFGYFINERCFSIYNPKEIVDL